MLGKRRRKEKTRQKRRRDRTEGNGKRKGKMKREKWEKYKKNTMKYSSRKLVEILDLRRNFHVFIYFSAP